MKGHPWRPVFRFGMLRCEYEIWSRKKWAVCSARATRFFANAENAAALCEHHASKVSSQVLRGRDPVLKEMSREEWEVCKVQES